MKNFFNELGNNLRSVMIGRNGPDTLATVSLGAAVVVMFINMFIPNIFCSILSYAFLIYSIFRIFSRNVSARRQEDERFTNFFARFKGAKGTKGTKNTKQHNTKKNMKVFTCEHCGQSLSVPKGKGTLKVTCPKCHHQTKIKS